MIARAPSSPVETRLPGTGKALLVWSGAVALLLFAMLLGVSLGAVTLSPAEVFDGLLDRGDPLSRTIVWDLRLPRVLLAVLVGANLGVAGALLQGVTRNPLADPHVLGITAAAGLAASFAFRVDGDVAGWILVLMAFAGGLVAAGFLYVASYRGGTSPTRLALSGVALASLFTAGTTMVLVTSNLTTQAALDFLAGGLFGRGWDDVNVLWPYALVGLTIALLLSRNMNILALGDEAAQSLGLGVERTRLIALVTAALLAGASVAVSGMIAFVGLVIPHIGRFLVGDDHRKLLPLSAILGAALIVYADTFARMIERPIEVPLGIVTAAIGAPFMLYLLRSKA